MCILSLQAELTELRAALSAAFAAAPRAAAYVDALQQLSASDVSLWVDPDQVLQAGEASGGLGAAAVQVEEQMMYAGGREGSNSSNIPLVVPLVAPEEEHVGANLALLNLLIAG